MTLIETSAAGGGADREHYVSMKWAVRPGQIGAWIAESDFGTSPAITTALHDAVDDSFLTYLPLSTARGAEEACASYLHTRYGWAVDADDVHLIPDVVEGLRLVIRYFCAPGAVIVPTPAYMPFLTVPGTLDREVVQVASIFSDGRWHLDLAGIDAAFKAGATLLVLCNPHNPLGQVMTPAELEAVSEVVERNGGTVFSDEIHAPIVYAGYDHVPYASLSAVAANHTVTATATSKGWNVPGLKVAQLILSNDAHREIWAAREPYPAQGGSILGAVATTAAYRDSLDWLDATVDLFDANRGLLTTLLAQQLPEVAWSVPEATYLAWIDFSACGIPGSPAAFLAEKAGVVVSDGALCGVAFASWVRFNFAMSPANLERAVGAIREALATLAPGSSAHSAVV